jgi:hypothetical protein
VVIIVNIIVSTVMFCYKEEIMNYISGLFWEKGKRWIFL